MGQYSHSTYVSSVVILISDTYLTAGETMTVTFMFNEPPWWGPFARFRLTHGTDKGVPMDTPHGALSGMKRDSDDTKIYTVTFTPSENTGKAVGRITLDLNDILYQYGTRPCGTFQSVEYTVDTRSSDVVSNPHLNHVSIRLSDNVVSSRDETMTVTFEFNEEPWWHSFSISDVRVSHGTLSDLTQNSDNHKIYTATFTPTEHKNRVVGRISLDLANLRDSTDAGNDGTGVFESAEYIVDSMPPANVTNVFIRLSEDYLTGEEITVTFEFDEGPWSGSFTLTDLVAPNGVLSNLVVNPDNDKIYTATFTPNANTNRSVGRITLNLMHVSDGRNTYDEGHPGTGVRQSMEYTVDTMPRNAPSNPALNRVSIRLSDTLLTLDQGMTVTFEFNGWALESSFTVSDIVVPLGILHDLVREPDNAKIYTVKFTPHNKTSKAVGQITLDLSKLQDSDGNAGTGVYQSAEFTVDNLPPAGFRTVSIRLSDSHLTPGETATVTFEFDEGPVQDSFTLPDVVAPHGRLSNLVRAADNARIYTATFTPDANVHGARGRITLDLAGLMDEARNSATGVYQSSEYTIENAASSSSGSARLNRVDIRLSDSYLIRGEAVRVTFAFNVPLPDEDFIRHVVSPLGDLFVRGWDDTERVCTAIFTPNVTMGKGVGRISLDLSKVKDEDGNPGAGMYQSAEYTVDTVRPQLDRITVANTHLSAGETATVTFAFSKEVSEASLRAALDLSNVPGILDAPVSADGGKTWTALLTPPSDTRNASGVIRVNTNSLRDPHGNAGLGDPVSSNTYTLDTVRPTLARTGHSIDDNQLGMGHTVHATIKFSEPVKGFDASDVILAPGSGSVGQVFAAWQPGSDGSSDTWEVVLHAPGAGVTSAYNPISVNLAGVNTRTGSAGFHTLPTGLSYIVDTVRPTLLGTRISYGAGETDTVLKFRESALVSFTFSEPVTDFGLNDVLLVNGLRDGMLSHFTSTGDGSVWTATLSAPTRNITSSNNTFRVNMRGVNDRAGNAGEGVVATGVSYDIDTVAGRPGLRITLADSTLTVGESTTVTFHFNEAVTGFDANDIVLTSGNGTLSNLTVGADGKTWTATLTPTANTQAANNTIRVDLAGVRNAAGTAGAGNVSSANYAVDTVQPMLRSLLIADRRLAANEETTITITFSKALDPGNFTLADLAIIDPLTQQEQSVGLRGTLSNLRTTDGGTTWQLTLKSPSADNTAGNLIVLKLRDMTDLVGNVVGGGNVSGDTAGRNYIAYDQAYANDSIRPRVERISVTHGSGEADNRVLRAGEILTLSIVFTEPVTGLDLDDISLSAGASGGTLSNLNSADGGTTWTATITAPAFRTTVSDVRLTVRLGAQGVSDLAGNTSAEGEANTDVGNRYSVDTTNRAVPPTATITLADNHLIVGETTTVTFAFSDRVNDFTADDVILSNANGTLGALTANADGKTWTATFRPAANVNSTASTIGVNLAGVTDTGAAAGVGQASSASYSIHTVRPGATITLDSTSLTMRQSTTVRFAFSEAVTGFSAEDVVLSDAHGTLGPLTADADGRTWTATFTPAANTASTSNTIRVNLAGVRNAVGNAGEGDASSASYAIDTTAVRPTATITLADSHLTAGETTTVTFVFNSQVNGFTADDIVLSDANGTLGPLTGNSLNTIWTATFTPTAHVQDASNTIRVNLAGVTNRANRTGVGSASSANYQIDTVEPTRPYASITLANTELRAGETTTVSFRFNQSVTGFDASDIVLSDANGTLSAPTANAERTVWTATFTPTANVNDAANTIRVNLAGVTGAAGNAGVGTVSSANYSVDTRDTSDTSGPTATITLADSALTAGESTTVSIRFNKPVNGFDASDVVLSDANGTLGALTPNAERTLWTATFTPTANVIVPTNTIRVNLSGVTDDAGNAGVGMASSAHYSVDTRDTSGPTATITLADSALSAGESTTVSFRFNEPVNGFDANDVVLTDANGTLGALAANAERTVWTATFTPTANASAPTNTIRVNLRGVRDDAGNAGIGSAVSTHYSVDTVRPTATIALADNALIAGESTTVTIRFNEPVTGLDASDVVCTSGTLSAPTANAERTVWTAIFTPTANTSAPTNTLRANLSGVADDAGNAGTGSAVSTNYSVDTVRPTATIALADSALNVGETTTVSIRFNKPVTGLDSSDVVCTGGTLSAPTANAERTVWTATFTPTANIHAPTNTIRVNLTGVRDDAGNAGTESAISTHYSVDTRTDTSGPTATITLADSVLAVGESTTVSFRFNEPVNDFDASDIVCTSGTLSAPTANTERTLWTATFTPTANTNAPTNTIRVNLANVRDDAGNAGTGSAISTNYRVDTVRPRATITLADTALTAGESMTVSFRFSEPVNGFDTDDIVYTNGTLTMPTANAERTVWTATYTPAEDISARASTIRVNLAGVTDDAGNAGTGSAISANYSVDTIRPTVIITLADSALTAGESTTVRFIFNEPVNGLDASDIVCPNGRLSTPMANAERTVWTATFTPNAHANARTNAIRVDLAGVRDDAGNTGTGRASSASYSVHTIRPTATIALADDALTAGESTTVRFIFNEPVNGLDTRDIVCPNGTLSPPTANAERTLWTATLTPNANANARTNTISMDLAGVTNDAGNAGTGSASSTNYSVETTRPTATIALADSALTVGESTTVSFRFSEPVNGLDASDIVCTSGTLSAPTANAERTVWTATLTPTANVSVATNTISVNLSGVRDDAGNAGVGSASSANYSVDTTRPTATITLADTALTAGETTTVSFRFSEPVTGLDASEIVYMSGTLSAPTANAERTVWTATLTPTANVSVATNTISMNLSGVRDDAGNAGVGSASSANYSVDTERPTATLTLADNALTAGETTTVSFRFSEPVTGLDASDIVCTDANGTLSSPTANAERTVWTSTFTPTDNASAPVNTIRVNLAGVRDDAGNVGTGSAISTNYSVDTRRPTATITLADSVLAVGESTTVMIRFSEPVEDFDASDIVYTNGTLSPPTANAERTLWTATFTPTANVSAPANTIRVNLAGVRDDAGNAGIGSAISTNYSVDTVRPTATITLADNALTAGESTTVSFRFNEPVTGLDTSDIVCTGGTLSAPTANAERTVWTATLTPTANVSAPANTIRVNLAGVSDDAGNTGTGSAISDNYSVDTRTDTTGPTATITLADNALTAGESTTVSFRFNEPVNDLDISDIVCPSGTLSPPTANAERTVWTATLTPTANINAPANTLRVNLAGVRDDAGNAGTGSASSGNYSVDTRTDTTGPTATITLADNALTAGETTTVSFRFNEPVNDFDISDIVCTSGTLSPPTANTERTVWTALFTPTANVSALANTIRVNLAGVRDDAGNAGTEIASSANYSVDTRRPTATVMLADNALSAGKTTTVTIIFSEPVNGLDTSDILCTSGTLSPPTANAERTVWTATFTPTANVSAPTNTIRVNLTGVRDDAGNTGTGSADSADYSVDTRPADTTGPTATIALADTHLTVGETTTVSITFNEPVTGFTRDDVVLSEANGTLTDPTTNDQGRTWTATFTPTAGVENSNNTISVNQEGVRNAAGRAGVGRAPGASYQIDTRAPVLASATVNANQLVLRYTEGSSLDATHIPPTTAFTVRVDNVLTAVTAIAVGAQEKTVSLTLATAVAAGQAVSVAYTDPTTGNDANAVQDAAGNDAASFAATPVDNHTPAPPGPAPSPPEGPTPKDTKDTDGDSIPDSLEDETPGLPDPSGAAPVAGDGNGDGVRDSTQAAVGSTSVVRGPTGESRSTPVTLVAGSQDGKVDPASGARITRLKQEDAPALPKGMEMPLGLLSFKATLATGRSSEKFSLYLDPALGVNGYWMQDGSGTWVNLSSAAYGGKMGSEGGRLRLDFEISDGGRFDADGQANGAITAPGAAAQMPLSIVGLASDLAPNGFWL
ncbi:hypothetical protein D8B22_11735 [Verminephrobacter aporrectodeae subsp. tuberculatae]|uniref:Ig-like domain-containing protein n=3 Tax=Verminephrobacter aporrectodeae TaxID=1110389 RepID=UPI0022442D2B|nr:Ig-like domain-containing protein [Verminephrobacter aporrectodeae]MCW8169760.1 hypothetical protein [Verminephrobacter aporrectodeae subsp. tuberculatae]